MSLHKGHGPAITNKTVRKFGIALSLITGLIAWRQAMPHHDH